MGLASFNKARRMQQLLTQKLATTALATKPEGDTEGTKETPVKPKGGVTIRRTPRLENQS